MLSTREPVLSGTWYPADPAVLTRQVDAYLDDADLSQRPAGRAWLALIPHAGYAYSGPTAGRLLGLLRAEPPRRVVILAPNHRVHLDGVALSGARAFATPLGDVPVDSELVRRLAATSACAVDDAAHGQEHAVEIQLPLLQRAWPGRTPHIVPMLVPRLSAAQREDVARALTAALADTDQETLLLVSSDFTHYGAAYGYVPFADDIPASLERLDSGAVLKILAGDVAGLLGYGQETGITMCGLEATALALSCGLPTGYEGALVDYRRSGDRDRNYTQSVSYASILLCHGTDAADSSASARGGP